MTTVEVLFWWTGNTPGLLTGLVPWNSKISWDSGKIWDDRTFWATLTSLFMAVPSRSICCSSANSTWLSCRKFYSVYASPSPVKKFSKALTGWCGGLGQLHSVDDRDYKLTKPGSFVLLRSDDRLFEIQARLVRFRGHSNGPLSFSFFDSYSISFKGMPSLELKLKDFDKTRPFLGKNRAEPLKILNFNLPSYF